MGCGTLKMIWGDGGVTFKREGGGLRRKKNGRTLNRTRARRWEFEKTEKSGKVGSCTNRQVVDWEVWGDDTGTIGRVRAQRENRSRKRGYEKEGRLRWINQRSKKRKLLAQSTQRGMSKLIESRWITGKI